MQKICFFLSFYRAKIIPKVILTGSPGGTVIVIISKNLTIISSAVTISLSLMMRMLYEATAKQKRKIRNFVDCFWNSFDCSLGKEIIRINWPFKVTKLVLITHTGIP